MEERELIQVSLRLPASALESLSRLTEQLQKLAAAVRGPADAHQEPGVERGENTVFDFSRFQDPAVERVLPEAPAAQAGWNALADAAPAGREVLTAAPEAVRAGWAVKRFVEDPALAGPSGGAAALEAEAAKAAVRELEAARAAESELREQRDGPVSRTVDLRESGEAEAVDADAETGLDEARSALAAEMDGETVSAVRATAETAEKATSAVRAAVEAAGADASAARAAVETEMDVPGGAAFLTGGGAETPQSRWDGPPQTAAAPRPAPLTAEEVSRAFQRDGRRYDCGFPLY